MRKVRGQVIYEDEEEDGPYYGALGDAMGEWKDGGATTHSLPSLTEVAPEPPRQLNTAPSELHEKDAVVDAVERFTQINCRERRDVTSVDSLTDPFDSVEHGVLRTVVGPICVLNWGENMIVKQVR